MKAHRLLLSGMVMLAALMLCTVTFAGSTSANLPVTAEIANSCTFGTVNTLAFGNYDTAVANAAGGSDLAGSSTFGLTCTNGASIVIALGPGGHASGGQRYMASGANQLTYSLYSDSTRATAWDTFTTVSDTGTGNSKTYTIYGLIPKGQAEPIGSYSDTVSINVSY